MSAAIRETWWTTDDYPVPHPNHRRLPRADLRPPNRTVGSIVSYPPRYSQPGEAGPATVKMPASRFSILPTMRGFEVIDHDGRAVDAMPTREGAEGIRDDLNEAAAAGRGALMRNLSSLRAQDDDLYFYESEDD